MADNFYGAQPPRTQLDAADRHVEELSLLGYSVMNGVIADEELPAWRARIDELYARQAAEFGERALEAIGELDICRAPLLQDREFVKLIMNKRVHEVIGRILGNWAILSVQNGVINRPDRKHHQSAWHRDLPHQNWISSRPLAIGAMHVLDEFSETTGATMFLPGSHRSEGLPSQPWISKHAITLSASPGSVILFDAMTFHRAGVNRSKIVRRGINHLYTVPIIKQQYDFPRALGPGSFDDPEILKVLGYTSQVPADASEWRRNRLKRHKSEI